MNAKTSTKHSFLLGFLPMVGTSVGLVVRGLISIVTYSRDGGEGSESRYRALDYMLQITTTTYKYIENQRALSAIAPKKCEQLQLTPTRRERGKEVKI